MSTVTKLNPMIRQNRQDRRGLRQFMQRHMREKSHVGVICLAAYIKLDELRLDPARTGLQKQAIVLRLQQEIDANLAGTLKTPEV